MAIANAAWFDREETRLRAMGHNIAINPARRAAPVVTGANGAQQCLLSNGGIIDPQSRVLAGRHQSGALRFGGGGLVPQAAVRELCCVAIEWSDMTLIIQARTIRPLLVYEGPGAPAKVCGGASTSMAAGRVTSGSSRPSFLASATRICAAMR
ncbi:hypothetical protein MTR62_11905 [Novosphingobium sp. 1949]|uniref:Uncharacterized protein n=1 Tax=Novosphingobium organovorum TaxID=2930092 RepID=A0ABT0BE98_9SPHN|nr:hypothetical protein [Novosphingobium organovorum]MCJ2183388.1 hypothetical protein [Novosphingobium organovorum]